MRDVLVLNAGSSSIKFAVFGPDLQQRLSGSAVEIGRPAAALAIAGKSVPAALRDHGSAVVSILDALTAQGVRTDNLAGAAHRIVHGGAQLTAPARLTADVIGQIEDCVPLAPLHNPHGLAAIRTLAQVAPHVPQCASFDTAFHATIPAVAQRYAVPDEIADTGIRRFGFHGISYASLVDRLPSLSGGALPERLLACHLGNGASLCAIHHGASVATTMGYSPLEGLTMGTRSGNIDPNAVLRLAADRGIGATTELLNKQSGLLGLSGISSDMRDIEADDSASARFAFDHFCYWAIRHAGGLISAMGGLDGLAFTGGIGEHSVVVRERIMSGMGFMGLSFDPTANAEHRTKLHTTSSRVGAWIVPAREEEAIARAAYALLRDGG